MESLLISLLIFIIVAGLIYYIITLLPLPAPFKQAALIVTLVIFVLILVDAGAPDCFKIRKTSAYRSDSLQPKNARKKTNLNKIKTVKTVI